MEGQSRVRIIPARAGFTTGNRWGGVRKQDHPRSRGVYHCWNQAGAHPAGSSPLARGLLGPAVVSPGLFVDHPRSRGVYSTTQMSW